MTKLNKTVIKTLQDIAKSGRVSEAVGKPLLAQGLIRVNTADVDANGLAAAVLTDAAKASMPKDAAANAGGASQFTLMSGVVLPESKRGFGRVAGPSKYPFDTMETGQSFFVPVSADMPNPLKTLGSTVSNATNKYRVATGQMVEKTRTKRGDGNKAVLDAEGNKVKETVSVPVYNYPRKFTIRSVKAGTVYGPWTAPADGVVIARTV